MDLIVQIADLYIYLVVNTYRIYTLGGFQYGFGRASLADSLRDVADILDRKFKDTESGEVLNYVTLYEQWLHDAGGVRTTSDASSFQLYLHNATSKNGFLEEMK